MLNLTARGNLLCPFHLRDHLLDERDRRGLLLRRLAEQGERRQGLPGAGSRQSREAAGDPPLGRGPIESEAGSRSRSTPAEATTAASKGPLRACAWLEVGCKKAVTLCRQRPPR